MGSETMGLKGGGGPVRTLDAAEPVNVLKQDTKQHAKVMSSQLR